ncbi:probable F-box protein At4g22030 [Oryza brachyantha]|uniref:probable F-box protein At4g22030 n=1 Tax=Oryza brachyantha TaxID=4533 RepID=UPI001ADBC5A9|nr:probable F-box protein At4g22030 [Oryza brachyantha]
MESLVRSLAGGGVVLPPPARQMRRRRWCTVASLRGSFGVGAATATCTAADRRRQLVDELRLVDDEGGAVATSGRSATAQQQMIDVGCEVEKLRAVADAAADRADMHDIIGRQRDNWNHLLLHSNNSLLLAASVMAALAPAAPGVVALKASAGVLLATAAVTMAAVNKIQPSQLAEEQRNATRLWRQLERDVRAALELAPPTKAEVQDAMDRMLALDAAYPLPLLPVMLDKFPKAVEPTRWWPIKKQQRAPINNTSPSSSSSSKAANGAGRRAATAGNGWTQELEEEMRGILRVIKAKDENEYVSVGKMVLALNKHLAVAGPALAGTAALAAAFIGAGEAGAWASGAAVLGGVLAAAVNTVEHGWQVGMLFELCRNVAGVYRKIREDIEANLEEGDVERRENGEVFETKVALQLGRSPSELKQFRVMASPAVKDGDIKDFAGKLV